MYKPTIAIAALCLCVLPWARALAENGTNPRPQNDPNSVTIAPIESKVMDKTLEIRYRITNGSDHDIWLCERVLIGCAFETYTQELGQTLVMRRRFDVRPELMWSVSPTGSYVRLRAGETRTELVMLHLPVPLLGVFTSAGRMETQDVSDAVACGNRFLPRRSA